MKSSCGKLPEIIYRMVGRTAMALSIGLRC